MVDDCRVFYVLLCSFARAGWRVCCDEGGEQVGLATKSTVTRKQKKERKRRERKMWGTHKAGDKKKKKEE